MVQFSTLFNVLSMNIHGDKKNRGHDIGKEAASDFVKEAKRNQLLLTCSGAVSARDGRNLASAHSKRGKKGFNQDSLVVWEEFGCQDDMVLCGVFDGHGPWGHIVSKTVREFLPPSLLCNWQEGVSVNGHEIDVWEKSYYRTCAVVDREIQQNHGIDSFYSGTTALTLVRHNDILTIANIGDSRAVLASISDDGNLVATQLTIDQKPNLPHENERIAKSKGRVYSCPDEPGLYRVWMPTVKGPGLAVSRAFGDYYIKEFGLISEPVITHTNISRNDRFVILATDGVWDVISNEDAVEIVASAQMREESGKMLVQFAACEWKQRGKAAVMDDISAICLFLQGNNSDTDFQYKKCVSKS